MTEALVIPILEGDPGKAHDWLTGASNPACPRMPRLHKGGAQGRSARERKTPGIAVDPGALLCRLFCPGGSVSSLFLFSLFTFLLFFLLLFVIIIVVIVVIIIVPRRQGLGRAVFVDDQQRQCRAGRR